jgi:hypothetical protein
MYFIDACSSGLGKDSNPSLPSAPNSFPPQLQICFCGQSTPSDFIVCLPFLPWLTLKNASNSIEHQSCPLPSVLQSKSAYSPPTHSPPDLILQKIHPSQSHRLSQTVGFRLLKDKLAKVNRHESITIRQVQFHDFFLKRKKE